MRKILRDTLAAIRSAGGKVEAVTGGGRHTRIEFSIDGRREIIRLHSGSRVSAGTLPRVRSHIRRKTGEIRP